MDRGPSGPALKISASGVQEDEGMPTDARPAAPWDSSTCMTTRCSAGATAALAPRATCSRGAGSSPSMGCRSWTRSAHRERRRDGRGATASELARPRSDRWHLRGSRIGFWRRRWPGVRSGAQLINARPIAAAHSTYGASQQSRRDVKMGALVGLVGECGWASASASGAPGLPSCPYIIFHEPPDNRCVSPAGLSAAASHGERGTSCPTALGSACRRGSSGWRRQRFLQHLRCASGCAR